MEEEYLYFDQSMNLNLPTVVRLDMNKNNYRNANWVDLHSSTLNTFKVWNVNETAHLLQNHFLTWKETF